MNRRALFVVSGGQLLTMLIWFNFSAILPVVSVEWQLTGFEAGLIIAVFQAGYAVAVFGFGALADRVDPRRILAGTALLAGAAGMLFATFATGFGSALLWRAVAGIGLGGIYVPGLKYLSELFRGNGRGFAYGVYVAALVVGSGASLLLAGPLLAVWGWRTVALATSAGALAAVALFLTLPPPPARAAPASAAPLSLASIRRLLGAPRVLPFMLAYVVHMWELYAFWGWTGPFMVAATTPAWGAEVARQWGNVWGGTMIMLGGVGCWAAGRISDRYGRVPTLLPIVALSAALALAFGWLYGAAPEALVPLGLLYGLVVVADSPVYSAGVSENAPPDLAGLALGVQQVLGFGITIVSPAVFGATLQWVNPQQPFVHWWPSFSVLALGPLAGLVLIGRMRRKG